MASLDKETGLRDIAFHDPEYPQYPAIQVLGGELLCTILHLHPSSEKGRAEAKTETTLRGPGFGAVHQCGSQAAVRS